MICDFFALFLKFFKNVAIYGKILQKLSDFWQEFEIGECKKKLGAKNKTKKRGANTTSIYVVANVRN